MLLVTFSPDVALRMAAAEVRPMITSMISTMIKDTPVCSVCADRDVKPASNERGIDVGVNMIKTPSCCAAWWC